MSTPITSTGGQPLAEVRLVLPYPPSANTYWKPSRGRGLVPSDEATAYKAAVTRAAMHARVLPLVGPVRMVATVYRPRKSGDLDNTLKVLNDALNEVAWLDDDQVIHIEASREDDAAAPRVELHATAERHATREEADAHRRARAARAQKARATRNRNRAAKARAGVRLSPALRLPKRRDDE
ncbi:RusA family crossover junction endodeoxyribonuclease [Myxococcus sp. CA051A]|uniref:RusA family crossover junction endodeoxyribonuclease n=1 Tax=Myxococcus sp. CA051A TaxID=2741739 RepID=UPI0020C5CF07|nr:RusA family crossover junction endodeoxyribonuclease [Myxococcus sp. CA051A]